ncbi:unnamed protein product [Eruca vesicaria subsp. sativa]|uniref:Uncharacterized protein n=1 Tax=Eruca vesicaria subsp. sativa TaxID=29727 RepID=A0ABC8K7T6_ERUVS|nr:unnamed protein product [Eruca vesicaria subsp. sativa]
MAAISYDLFSVETRIFVQAAASDKVCGNDCKGSETTQECVTHCLELRYKMAKCEPYGDGSSRSRCCCSVPFLSL